MTILTSVITPPAAEPLDLAELKTHLRILHDGEDSDIAAYALAARHHIETTTGRALVNRTIDALIDAWPLDGVIRLPWAPLASVSGVYYRDTGGVEQTLADSAYEVVTQRNQVRCAYGSAWPATAVRHDAVRVRYVAGYGTDGSTVPPALLHALKLLTEHFYYRRGATSDSRPEPVPMSVDALCSPFMTYGWI